MSSNSFTWVTKGGDLGTADWGCLAGRCASLCQTQCVCRLRMVAVRQAALVSDESALEACFTTMRYPNWWPLPFYLYILGWFFCAYKQRKCCYTVEQISSQWVKNRWNLIKYESCNKHSCRVYEAPAKSKFWMALLYSLLRTLVIKSYAWWMLCSCWIRPNLHWSLWRFWRRSVIIRDWWPTDSVSSLALRCLTGQSVPELSVSVLLSTL